MIAVQPELALRVLRAEAERRERDRPQFANDQQREFFDSRAPELLYSGAFGAGKSRILCEKAFALAKRYPGAPIGIFRKVAASLAATTKLTFFRDVLPEAYYVRQNKTEGWIELANGSRIWFLGLDADPTTRVPSKVGSLDLAFAFVDEAVELDEGDWMMLAGRLRYPGVPYTQLAAATNPADPNHWLKRRFTPSTPEREFLSASTFDNRLLPEGYIERMRGLVGLYRTRYVEGNWIAVAGALWSTEMFQHRPAPVYYVDGKLMPYLSKIVVSVDPAVTSGATSDETGIVVAGKGYDGNLYVMADRSGRYPAADWPRRVVDVAREFSADEVVAEVNNGGDLVEAAIRAVDPNIAYRAVTASRGKRMRHEPVVQLYVRGLVFHAEALPELESQMVTADPDGKDSPDRVDALTQAATHLMLDNPWSGSGAMVGIA